MSWTYPDFQYSVLQRLCMYLIKYGPIPEHIAIIMDGNRRFAATNNMKTSDGHLQGFSKLSETLRWCKDLGVKELTVFAFSVENFNRSSEEVSFLLQLAADKLSELLEKIEELCADGICVRLIGNLSTLPTRIQQKNLGSELMLKQDITANCSLMSWTYPDFQYSVLQRLCMYLIKYGPIPEHIAIIMDGNRRFAATNNMKTSDGHLQGFSKLSETLRWCKDLGVKELTVFAFSVENFNRSSEEVSFLLQLAADKLSELLEKIEELCADGICVRIIGNLSTLPHVFKTGGHSILNVCMAYSSQDELTESVEHIRAGVRDKLIYPSDISPELLSGCLYTRLSRPLDLLIRTSGEVRLSDFLLWQSASSGTVHKFVESFWPDLSFWNFLFVILHFQLAALHISLSSTDSQRALRIRRFLDRLDCEYWDAIEKRALLSGCLPTTDSRSTQRSVGDSLLS
ncbi:hypothetical protein AHF37_03949 [Paragonimus kellicotti]|nr:hypothetical protein AHF37_03949 [Paragonimus kellicotti]